MNALSENRLKVLWVEEEARSLNYERIVATQSGWDITDVNNVREAQDFLLRQRFDVVICDIILHRNENDACTGFVDPEAGIALLEFIRDPNRGGETSCEVTVGVVTAVRRPVEKARILGFLRDEKHYLGKPIKRGTTEFTDFAASISKYARSAGRSEQNAKGTAEPFTI